METPADAKKAAPSVAYVSHDTFERLIGQFRESGHAPSQIDNTILNGYAGSVRIHLIQSLRFLGLADDLKRPTPILEELVNAKDEAAQRAVMRKVLERAYAGIMSGVDLGKTTPGEVQKVFRERTGLDGETLSKAIRFFVAAHKATGSQVSPFLLKRSSAPRKPKAANTAAAGKRGESQPEPQPPAPPPPSGARQTPSGFKTFDVIEDGEARGLIEYPIPLSAEWCAAADRAIKFLRESFVKPTEGKRE